jgi:competence protein ComEA
MKQYQSMMHLLILSLLLLGPIGVVYSKDTPDSTPITETMAFTVNINSAGAEEMATLLKGIGMKKAQAIIAYREENGPFPTVEAVTQVKGIGPSFLEKNAQHLTLK